MYRKILTPQEAARQLRFAADTLDVCGDKFAIKVTKIAQTAFLSNFTHESFTDDNGHTEKWAALSNFTLKRRRKYGTQNNGILVDTGILKRSIRLENLGMPGKKAVYTDPIKFRSYPRKGDDKHTRRRIASQRHPRHNRNFCYAGIHNDPPEGKVYKGTHTPLIKRQFMGHTKLVHDQLVYLEKTVLLKNMP